MKYLITPQMIEDWVARNFSNYRKRRDGCEIIMPNPFIPDDEKYKFNIGLEEKETKRSGTTPTFWVHDWREKYQEYDSSFVKFVQRYKNISFHEAIKDIGGTISRTIIRPGSRLKEQEIEEPEIISKLPDGTVYFRDNQDTKLRHRMLAYLKRRVIDEDKANANSLGYTGTTIVFPYFEYGNLIYWQSRDIYEKIFRFPADSAKSNYLYGFDHAEPENDIFIVEAPIDALTIGAGALAIGGDSLSAKQIRKLRSLLPGRVVLCTDNDDSGKALIRSMYFELRAYFTKVYFVLPPDPYKDWNDLEKEEGAGAARRYINEHVTQLTPPAALKLKSKICNYSKFDTKKTK